MIVGFGLRNKFSPYRVCAVLTAILSQAGPRPQQQHHFVSSSLDQVDCPCMGNAACRLPVNLHYLISNLSQQDKRHVIINHKHYFEI